MKEINYCRYYNDSIDSGKLKIICLKFFKYNNLYYIVCKYIFSRIKVKLYTILLRPIIIYGAETWLCRKMEKKLIILKRKILKNIFVLIKDKKTDQWRIRKKKKQKNFFRNQIYKLNLTFKKKKLN